MYPNALQWNALPLRQMDNATLLSYMHNVDEKGQADNARYQQKVAALGQCRQTEDEVWLKAQRDPAVKTLEAADKLQDGYMTAARYINLGFASLPDEETQKADVQGL